MADTSMEKKKVLVTGASGGIGRAVAVECARNGYYVICHYNRGKEKCEQTLNLIKENGGDGEMIQFDITDREACFKELNALTEKHGALWGVINNAGVNKDNTFVGLSGEEWDGVVHTNLDSFFNVIQPLAMPMCRKKKGRIIVISSVSGVIGNRGQTNYSASKAGLIGFGKSLAEEVGPSGIRVNMVAPGVIDTDMNKWFSIQTI